jgi:hypothetical protein
MLISGYVVMLPLAFLFCGPFLSDYQGRVKVILWFSLISVVYMGILYLTDPELRIATLIWAAAWILVSLLGLAAAAFGWHLGPRGKKFFEKIGAFWLKFLEFFLNT